EKLQQEQLQAAGEIPTPEEVRRIRTALGLSVSDFAKVLAVTRQTIHAWERTGLNALQLSPAALLLGLLAEEIAGRGNGVFRFLLRKAAARGQEIQAPTTPRGGTGGNTTGSLILLRSAGSYFFAGTKTAA